MDQDLDGPNDEFAFMVKVGDAGQAEAVAAARRALGQNNAGLVRALDIIHATVVHVGDANVERALSLVFALAGLIRVAGFTITFDRCEWRPHPRCTPNGIAILVASAPPSLWRTLRGQVAEIPRRLGNPKTGGEQPHLTVAYDCPPFEGVALDVPVVWRVTNFQLIRILMGKRRHREIGRWGLT